MRPQRVFPEGASNSMSSNVIATLHDDDGHRCVKITKGPDGSFGFKEFRKDPEDAGGWTLVNDTPPAIYATEAQATAAARAGIAWFREMAPAAKE